MLLQAYDYLELSRRLDCRLQIGGSDQWGNITAGCELIRRVDGGEADAITLPAGHQGGRREVRQVGVGRHLPRSGPDAPCTPSTSSGSTRTTPTRAGSCACSRSGRARRSRRSTRRPPSVPHERAAQRALARELTVLVHGEDAWARAARTSEALFGRGRLDEADPAELEVALGDAPTVELDGAAELPTYAELFQRAGLVASISEAVRLAAGGGLSVNDDKVDDVRQSACTGRLSRRPPAGTLPGAQEPCAGAARRPPDGSRLHRGPSLVGSVPAASQGALGLREPKGSCSLPSACRSTVAYRTGS